MVVEAGAGGREEGRQVVGVGAQHQRKEFFEVGRSCPLNVYLLTPCQ